MNELLQLFAGQEATRGELLVWIAIIGAGFAAGLWLGFEVTRAFARLLAGFVRSVFTPADRG